MASASTANETTPLMQSQVSPSAEVPRKPSRNVTFSPNPAIISVDGGTTGAGRTAQSSSIVQPQNALPSQSGQPMLAALNSKLRRRNSYGAPLLPTSVSAAPSLKIGPQRTTKNAQKLKLLPNPEFGEDGPDEESGRDVYSQYTRIKDPTARRDAARLGKADRDRLPRVTAYCTANKYQMEGLMKYLKGRGKLKGANPKAIDECIYTPYNYSRPRAGSNSRQELEVQSVPVPMRERRHSDSAIEVEDNNKHRRGDLLDLQTEAGDTALSNGEQEHRTELVERRMSDQDPQISTDDNLDFDTHVHMPEVFFFEYGVVVIWGMSLQHEQRLLKEIAKFESEKLAQEDVETECFNFYYTREYQARIYNDFITLKDKGNWMQKLTVSHALAQSVKVRHIFSHSFFNPHPLT